MHIENNHIKGYSLKMTITQIDFSILDWIQNTLKNPVLDVVMPVITHLGDGGFIWILLTLILIVIPRTRKTGILIGISLAAGAVAYLLILKPIIARPRPFTQNPATVPVPADFSVSVPITVPFAIPCKISALHSSAAQFLLISILSR